MKRQALKMNPNPLRLTAEQRIEELEDAITANDEHLQQAEARYTRFIADAAAELRRADEHARELLDKIETLEAENARLRTEVDALTIKK